MKQGRGIGWQLVRSGAVYGLGSSLNAGAALLLIPLVVTHLEPAAYGRVSLAEMLLGLLVVGSGIGLNVRLLAVYPTLEEPERSLTVRRSVGLVILTSTITAGIFLVLSLRWGQFVFPGLSPPHFVLVAVLGIQETIILIYASLFRASERGWSYIRLSVAQFVVGIIASVVLVSQFQLRDIGMLLGRMSGNLVAMLTLIPVVKGYLPMVPGEGKTRVLLESFPIVPATFASVWIAAAPRFFLDHLAGTAAVGTFALTSRVAGVVSILLVQPFSLAWHPILFAVRKRIDASRLLGQAVAGYALAGAVIAVAVLFLARGFGHLVWRGEYTLDLGLLGILGFANVAVGLMQAVNIGPYVANKLTHQLPLYALGAVAIMPLSLILIGASGPPGAGVALLSTYTLVCLGLHVVSQRLFPISVDYHLITVGLVLVSLSGWVSYRITLWGQVLGGRAIAPVLFLALAAAALWAFIWVRRNYPARPNSASS